MIGEIKCTGNRLNMDRNVVKCRDLNTNNATNANNVENCSSEISQDQYVESSVNIILNQSRNFNCKDLEVRNAESSNSDISQDSIFENSVELNLWRSRSLEPEVSLLNKNCEDANLGNNAEGAVINSSEFNPVSWNIWGIMDRLCGNKIWRNRFVFNKFDMIFLQETWTGEGD